MIWIILAVKIRLKYWNILATSLFFLILFSELPSWNYDGSCAYQVKEWERAIILVLKDINWRLLFYSFSLFLPFLTKNSELIFLCAAFQILFYLENFFFIWVLYFILLYFLSSFICLQLTLWLKFCILYYYVFLSSFICFQLTLWLKLKITDSRFWVYICILNSFQSIRKHSIFSVDSRSIFHLKAEGSNTDVYLQPVALYKDPFRWPNTKCVLIWHLMFSVWNLSK